MVAFLTTWSLADSLARSWRDFSRLAEVLSEADLGDVHPVRAAAREDLLARRLNALGLTAAEVARWEPGIFVDLRRSCAACTSRRQCAIDLDRESLHEDGVPRPGWQDYCPNVATLNMLSALIPAVRDARARPV